MTRLANAIAGFSERAGLIVRSLVLSVTGNWGLAVFSLVSAFALWMVIQDVENPRVEGTAPRNGGIAVEAINVPDGYLVEDIPTVTVKVEARKEDMATLRPDDFRARVDAKGIDPTVGHATRTVTVESRRSGVRVLDVSPSAVDVTLTPAAEREFPVTPNFTSQPPSGFEKGDITALDPSVVTVRGPQSLVDTVAVVNLDVNLSNARDETFSFEGDLVARTKDGNVVAVTLSQTRARLTMNITELFAQRTMALNAPTTGQPAPGFQVTSITLDPPVVQVTGPKAVIEGLRQPLNLEAVDLTGAKGTIGPVARNIQPPPNVSPDRQSILVRVEIQPIDTASTFFAAPTFTDVPTGLVVDGAYSVQVRVSGPLNLVDALKPTDIKAEVSLAGGTPGTAPYQVKVTVPAGLSAAVDPLTVTLRPPTVP